MINLTLKDGSVRSVEKGKTIYDVAKDISGRLAKEAVAGVVNGKTVDLSYILEEDVALNILTLNDDEGLDVFRHTTAHVMAMAVQNLFPGTKLAIGPSIENGFYYDFDTKHVFVPEDLDQIEKEMKRIISEDLHAERFVLNREDALKFVNEIDADYKVELINDLPEGEELSFYRHGKFVDLCAGPHLYGLKQIKAFKLLSIAGAYWRGDSDRKMLQRIYATAFPKASQLEEHLHRLEEAKKRDHRKLGKELKLFSLMEQGPGFPFFLPKGMIVKNKLIEYWRDVHEKAGYVEVETPQILNRSLWETSGHWFHYAENMYTLKIDDEDYAIKPMNCPGGMLVYKTELRSYRDFPMRVGELGKVHRHELSGALHGLMRVRAFTQDDAHIFMLPSQIKDEIKEVVRVIDEVYQTFGFKYHIELSTRPEKSMGSDAEWELAEASLQQALEESNLAYRLNPGDGAFYGPKIDFHLEDCIGRTWQCGTIQLDMQLPQRFELTYIGEDGEKHRPVVIHRVAFGSIERFVGILIEHFAGKFPTWLSPVQVKMITVADRHFDYANQLKKQFEKAGIRVELDARHESVGYKIREARLERNPYMLVIGDNEVEKQTISVRSRDHGELGEMSVEDLLAKVNKEIEDKFTV
ncbi:MAG: threonine--tRNA ligase [Clostridia bacterium]|nr:threonine--tRNA ligase [Clostridia bacterium]